MLPDLARRTNLDVRSGRLPPVARDLKPRVVLQMDHLDGAQLTVLPTLVYGAPPAARVDNGKLVYLRGPVPVRDTAAEQRAIEKLRQELDLLPGRRTTFGAADAPRFVEKLKRWRGDLSGAAAGIVKPSATLVPRLQVTTPATRPPGRTPCGSTSPSRCSAPDGKSGGRRVDAAAVVRAWQEGLGLVPLLDGGWAPCPTTGCAGTASASPICWRRARTTAGWRATRCPRWPTLCAELEHPAPPGLDRLAPLVEGFERLPDAALPADVTADAARLPARGRALAGVPASPPASAACWPTTWASARRCRRCACSTVGNRPDAGRLPHQRRAQLGRRDGAVPARPEGVPVPRRRARARRVGRRDAHHLRAAAARRRQAAGGTTGWGTVVLDEAQAIKNPDSQAARAAYAFAASFRSR